MFYSSNISDVFLQSIFKLNDEKIKIQVLQKASNTTRDNGNVQSHDKEESKLNGTITPTGGAHTLTHD